MSTVCNVTNKKEIQEKIKKFIMFYVIMFVLLLVGAFNLNRLGIYGLGTVGQVLSILTVVALIAFVGNLIVFLMSKERMKKQGQRCDVSVTDTLISCSCDASGKSAEIAVSDITKINKIGENDLEIILPDNEYYFAKIADIDEFMRAINASISR
ncbi:MAG: hypothetical protein ACI4IF_02945 [Acutalibacteraceae bacterium]